MNPPALLQGTLGPMGGILECFNNMHSDGDELLKFRADGRRADGDEHTPITAIHFIIIIMEGEMGRGGFQSV